MQSVRGTYDGKKLTLLEKVAVNGPRQVIVTFLDEPDAADPAEPIAERFERLYEKWYADTAILSDSRIFSHPDFLKMIELGEPAIPLMLQKLQKKHSFLFTALAKITGENPVKKEHKGKPVLVAKDWLEWGKQQKHIQ